MNEVIYVMFCQTSNFHRPGVVLIDSQAKFSANPYFHVSSVSERIREIIIRFSLETGD